MSSQPDPNPELKAVEAALGSLAPAPGRLDRDRVMYQAGRASVRRPSLARAGWPALAASLAVLALGEAAALSTRPSVRYVDRVAVVREPATPTPPPAPAIIPEPEPEPERQLARDAAPETLRLPFLALTRAETDYQKLRARVLRDGLDGLPEPPAYRAQPGGRPAGRAIESASALLRSEVDAILNPGDPS